MLVEPTAVTFILVDMLVDPFVTDGDPLLIDGVRVIDHCLRSDVFFVGAALPRRCFDFRCGATPTQRLAGLDMPGAAGCSESMGSESLILWFEGIIIPAIFRKVPSCPACPAFIYPVANEHPKGTVTT